jgi:hypothetical protein
MDHTDQKKMGWIAFFPGTIAGLTVIISIIHGIKHVDEIFSPAGLVFQLSFSAIMFGLALLWRAVRGRWRLAMSWQGSFVAGALINILGVSTFELGRYIGVITEETPRNSAEALMGLGLFAAVVILCTEIEIYLSKRYRDK